MINKNEIYKGTVCDFTVEGDGIVKIDSYPVFIKNAVCGDEILFEVTKLNKTYGFGRLKEVITP